MYKYYFTIFKKDFSNVYVLWIRTFGPKKSPKFYNTKKIVKRRQQRYLKFEKWPSSSWRKMDENYLKEIMYVNFLTSSFEYLDK